MLFQNFFTKTNITHSIRNYFDASWEIWKREIANGLWDWAVDGPFCSDTDCGQRLKPCLNKKHGWSCVRCGKTQHLPKIDFLTMRDRVIFTFEEDLRSYKT